MAAIIIDLIHPISLKAVQSWTFAASQASIRIGRSRRNDIALFSGVVSRAHAMLQFDTHAWTLQSLGTNGCYRDNKLVRSPVVRDGDIFRIAKTGPRLRVRFQATASVAQPLNPQLATQRSRRGCLSKAEILTARGTWLGPEGKSEAPSL